MAACNNITYDLKFNDSDASFNTYERGLMFDDKENYFEVQITHLTGVIPITITINWSVLSKYTVKHGSTSEADSSNLLTFGAIDETYVRKTDQQEALAEKADKEHTHEISDVTNLQTSLDNKAEKEHTHT